MSFENLPIPTGLGCCYPSIPVYKPHKIPRYKLCDWGPDIFTGSRSAGGLDHSPVCSLLPLRFPGTFYTFVGS